MYASLFVRALIILASISVANGQIKVLLTNDDGWATANIRAQNDALKEAGFNVVLSAPAENQSGTGLDDIPPIQLGPSGCEFSTCPPFAPATGSDPEDARLNYVNSFPFGIQNAGPPFFNGTRPDFVVSGPNIGTNLGPFIAGSGTVGAACEAAKEGVPSVAISGTGGSQVSFTTLSTPNASTITAEVFAALGARFTQALLADPFDASSPILPPNITLNLNYAAAIGNCTDPDAFKFVFTRLANATDSTPLDVFTCGLDRLPTGPSILAMPGCFASVSVINATTVEDADAISQAHVLLRLGSFLTCPN
ncbi:hypothetical protein M0805_002951 [Coniferiporia weirii]|nr:hypothetical protein M0805_002951 [Coniferiporia weirii]